MKVEAISDTYKPDHASVVESLESRLLGASQELSGSKRPDPEFDWLYQQLLAMEGQGEKNIYEFIRSQRSADGITPAYPTGKALMAVTLQVLTRLKEEKLEGSVLFKEVSGANSLAFNLDLFVKSFMREVFATKDDDAWEKSEW